jgi:transcriptional regulator of nitric oxide reductase
MAGGANVVLDKGYIAGAALVQYRAVKIGADASKVIQVAALADQPIGVVQETASTADVTSGRVVNVRHMGISACRAAAALATAGISVSADANGRVIASGATLNPRLGVLLSTAGALDDIVWVLLSIGASSGGA